MFSPGCGGVASPCVCRGCGGRQPPASWYGPWTMVTNRQFRPTVSCDQPQILANRQFWPMVNFGQYLEQIKHSGNLPTKPTEQRRSTYGNRMRYSYGHRKPPVGHSHDPPGSTSVDIPIVGPAGSCACPPVGFLCLVGGISLKTKRCLAKLKK